jgi:hypothetical protein
MKTMKSREYRFEGGAWCPGLQAGATILVCFECQAVDFNDAHNQLEKHLDERFGNEWTGWACAFDGFMNENGKGWDWNFMKEVRAHPTTQRIERSQGAASTIAEILGMSAHQVEVR